MTTRVYFKKYDKIFQVENRQSEAGGKNTSQTNMHIITLSVPGTGVKSTGNDSFDLQHTL